MAMGMGLGLILVALLPAAMGGASNPYAAVLLIVLALLAIGCGVGIAAFDLARSRLPSAASAAIAAGAALPVLAPIFMPMGTDLTIPTMYVFVIGLVFFAVRRSPASALFLLLTAVGPAVALVQAL